jgi:excisionase family DNA binding protein
VKRLADAPDVLTVPQAAQLLRIGRTAAYEAVRRGQIPAVRIGRSVRIPRHALERLLDVSSNGGGAKEEVKLQGPPQP